MKVLWEPEELATAEAYARHPDSPDAPFDPTVWEAAVPRPSDEGVRYEICWADLEAEPTTTRVFSPDNEPAQ